MEVAKIFENGRSQAVRLPKKYRFEGSEVLVQRLGDAVVLVPKDSAWKTFLEGLHGFSDDFMENGREPELPSVREEL
ncbi:type II toxin-antitoxin system VapB family antitoxin [Oscillospiraceae bacterium 42-9]|uniref:type II toxin-antitoxin system antitoxin VapB n=1 Tax=Acutalibacter sp. 1XD8-36 TaxID=2320852 RepID=UPI001411DD82|nr:AbrB/MazE/SpoVT family DNA-binding domain-containing protein [Acutalibacter sp. 1XD8-36]